jgi:hypothetical protein
MQNKTKTILALVIVFSLYGASVYSKWQGERRAELEAAQQSMVNDEKAEAEAIRAAREDEMSPRFLEILGRVRSETGYSDTIGRWGEGSGIFLPDSFWESLGEQDKAFLKDYAKTANYTGILVGELKPSGSISLDRTVWP